MESSNEVEVQEREGVPVKGPVNFEVAAATRLEGPHATEEAALYYLRKAAMHLGFVKDSNSSRSNSLAITNLEQAEMWCERDIQQKREAENPPEPEPDRKGGQFAGLTTLDPEESV